MFDLLKSSSLLEIQTISELQKPRIILVKTGLHKDVSPNLKYNCQTALLYFFFKPLTTACG